jgi:hypothetical protein
MKRPAFVAVVVFVLVVLASVGTAATSSPSAVQSGLSRTVMSHCHRPAGTWRAVCGLLAGPAGSSELPAKRDLADSFSLSGASPHVCGYLSGRWMLGAEVGKRFVTDARYASDYSKAAKLLGGALGSQARSVAAVYERIAVAYRSYCGKLRFSFRGGVVLTLAWGFYGSGPSPSHRPVRSSLGVVSARGKFSSAIVSGNADVQDVHVEPNGNVLVQFHVPTSLTGPIADPKPAQLCGLAQVAVATGVPTCMADGTIETYWPNATAPPFEYGADGAVYFGAVQSPGDISTYRFLNGQTVDLTPDPGQQLNLDWTSSGYEAAAGGQTQLLPPDQVLLTVPAVVAGAPSTLWLMRPDVSNSAYTATELAPASWQGNAWVLPDGNAYATGFQINGVNCELAQISAVTGQINPAYCENPSNAPLNQQLHAVLTGPGHTLLSTSNGQAWIIGAGEMAEVYPTVRTFPAPMTTDYPPGPSGSSIPAYYPLVVGHDLFVDTASYVSNALYSFDATTHTWSEILGPDANAAAPIPASLVISAIANDRADNETLILGNVQTGPWAVAVNRSTRSVTQIVGPHLHVPFHVGTHFAADFTRYDPHTDSLTYVWFKWLPANVRHTPQTCPIYVETVNVRTGRATQTRSRIAIDGSWPPMIQPLIRSRIQTLRP